MNVREIATDRVFGGIVFMTVAMVVSLLATGAPTLLEGVYYLTGNGGAAGGVGAVVAAGITASSLSGGLLFGAVVVGGLAVL